MCLRRLSVKKLPDSELDIMLIIWEFNRPVTRFEIEGEMNGNKNLSATTILSFLSRLQEKGFLEVTKAGKNNIYTAVIDKESYMRMDSENVLKKLYRNSIKNFVASLYDGDNLSETDIKELEEYLHQKRGK
ncbi:MAG: BlaI/MecI/CopY family transcriptional regulator [Lachnospiraceae bacterium]|nr:BlaI/MecI/CopY family transcriptional regulator [Lachnospiraceae bacterium]